MIRVVVCDDQAVVREGLELILNSDPEIKVVALAQDGAEAVEMTTDKQPELVLMDLNMPGMNGIQATREIHTNHPDIKVLVLTTFGEDEWVFDAIRNGAAGYLLKGTPRDELIEAVKGTVSGEAHIDPAVGPKLLAKVAQTNESTSTNFAKDLSERELDVLKLLAQGITNAEIADRLFLSKGTVRNYISSILAKLDVEDRTQAAVLAVRHGLVEDY
ncbi:MAG: DNA-binding response regulator [Chloroflexi bacterium]|nr:MAG: DNA-binding response regulator [Chloroflexota bacterium]MBL1196716.1 DNA-binding response regulator [Chloroflexota bacterium]NOH14009.1 response regulator transcription factor [Chloroflexota bacterium]